MLSINKKIVASTLSLFLFFVFMFPLLSFSDSTKNDSVDGGLVNCGNTTTTINGKVTLTNPCDFTDFVALINTLINWIIGLAGVLFTIVFLYGGYLYLTSGGDTGARTKAHKAIQNALYGFVVILVAWLIVYTILKTFVNSSSTSQTIFNFIGTN